MHKVDPAELLEKIKRTTAHRPLIQSYRHFIGIFAYAVVYYLKKSNDVISTGDFVRTEVY